MDTMSVALNVTAKIVAWDDAEKESCRLYVEEIRFSEAAEEAANVAREAKAAAEMARNLADAAAMAHSAACERATRTYMEYTDAREAEKAQVAAAIQ